MSNERIQELIEQATTKESFYPAGCNGHHEDRYYFDKEKFAQLIVRECMNLCDTTHEMYGMAPDTARISKKMMKQHFGVEE